MPRRTRCSKGWVVKLLISPADPTCEQSAGLETTQRDLPWLAEVQQGTDNGPKHLCSDHRHMRMLGKRKPAARVKVSIHNSRPQLNYKRKSGRSLDVGKLRTQSPLLPPQGQLEEALWQQADNFRAIVTFNCVVVASLFIKKKKVCLVNSNVSRQVVRQTC